MVNAVNFNIHYFYGEQKTCPNYNNVFSMDTDIDSKYTDISVRNTKHKFTRLEALRTAPDYYNYNIFGAVPRCSRIS